MAALDIAPAALQDLLIHLGRVSNGEDHGSPLTAAQWTCLRYLARAQPRCRTPSAFAAFQSTRRSTASQIVRSLEQAGLVTRIRAPQDGRSVRLSVTASGRAMLDADPLALLCHELEQLSGDERAGLARVLTRLGETMAAARGTPRFGHCGTCAHFAPCGETGHCACMDRVVPGSDVDRLCDQYRAGPDLATGQAPEAKTEHRP